MCVCLGGSIATVAMPCWCGARAEEMLLVPRRSDVRGAGEPLHTGLLHSGVCLVRSFGCLKHLSNTLGTAH